MRTTGRQRQDAGLYRAVWRWHFYAGVFTAPFLMLLALTGSIYLFHDEFESWHYRDYMALEAPQGVAKRPSELLASAVQSVPGSTPSSLRLAQDTLQAAEVMVYSAEGEALRIYVNPATAEIQGTVKEDNRPMAWVRSLHSFDIFGAWGNGLVEAAAGWVILLFASGLYLWWPRGSAKAFAVRGTPKRRVFWRDLHVLTGALAGTVVLFLALTGMPWTGVWGARFAQLTAALDQGAPQHMYGRTPESTLPEVGWTLSQVGPPESQRALEAADIGVDEAHGIAESSNIPGGFTLSLPQKPAGVYTASVVPDDLTQQRVLHIDRYSGAIVEEISFDSFGGIAKLVEYGIGLHMGTYLGLANKLVMLAGCIATMVLCVSGGVMWWKRRPPGGFGAPAIGSPRATQTLAAITVCFSLLFPLTAASLVVIAIADRFVILGFGKVGVVNDGAR